MSFNFLSIRSSHGFPHICTGNSIFSIAQVTHNITPLILSHSTHPIHQHRPRLHLHTHQDLPTECCAESLPRRLEPVPGGAERGHFLGKSLSQLTPALPAGTRGQSGPQTEAVS